MIPTIRRRITNTIDVLEDGRLRAGALADRELVTAVNAGVLGGCHGLDISGGVWHCLSLGAGHRRGLEVDIATSNIRRLYSRRVTRTEVRVWWVEMVSMYMVSGTGMAAGLVAYREVHRIVRG